MAKNCINQKCGKEIPSNATFCSFCGLQQVDDENLTEEEKLRKELNEAQETISLLKKALANAQHNSNSLAEKQQTIEKLQRQLTKAQEIEKTSVAKKNTQPKPRGLIVALIVVSVIAVAIICLSVGSK